MLKNYGQADPKMVEYATELYRPEDSFLAEVRARAIQAGVPGIHVGAFDGLHLEVLTRMCAARRVVEIGTLAGYSGVCLLRGMLSEGRLWTFEYNPLHAEVAKVTFEMAGFADRVDILVGEAVKRLPSIEDQGPFDLIFVDADKVSYPRYFEWAEKNLRGGGVLLADNTFGWNQILDTNFESSDEQASIEGLREFNRRVAESSNFRATMLPTAEGLTAAVKIKD
jgi:caffeoyl-CoA O-methyltransferase